MKKGFLMSFEGGEGCGKTTQINMFMEYLEKKNIPFLKVREPGGTPLGEKIRELLLNSKEDMSAQTEFLLFSASRSKLIADVVKPALKEGKVVVMDRYYDSSYAYQGYAGNLDIKDIKNITDFAIEGSVPDLTIYLDLSYDKGMERKSADEKLKNLDRMESKGKTFHEKVREGYLKVAKANPDRIVTLDAGRSKEAVFEDVKNAFEKRFK